jgi:hypothetical protein
MLDFILDRREMKPAIARALRFMGAEARAVLPPVAAAAPVAAGD